MPAKIQPTFIDISEVTEAEALRYGELVKRLGEEYSFWVDRDDPKQPKIGYQWLQHSGVYKLILNVILNIRVGAGFTTSPWMHNSAGISVSLSRSDPRTRKGGYFPSKGVYIPHHRRRKLDKGEYIHLFDQIKKNQMEDSKKIYNLTGRFHPLFNQAYLEIYDCIGQESVEHHELHTDVGGYEEGIQEWLKVGKLLEEHYAARSPE